MVLWLVSNTNNVKLYLKCRINLYRLSCNVNIDIDSMWPGEYQSANNTNSTSYSEPSEIAVEQSAYQNLPIVPNLSHHQRVWKSSGIQPAG